MTEFKIGDKIFDPLMPNNIYTILKVDKVSAPLPVYFIENKEKEFKKTSYCIGWKEYFDIKEVNLYGKILVDEQYKEVHKLKIDNIRIKIFDYNNRFYYQKMVNGNTIKFFELKHKEN